MNEHLNERYAIYVRVSTTKETQKESVEGQLEALQNFGNEHRSWINTGLIYKDYGKSGTTMDKRDDFKKMIADAKDKKFTLLLVRDVSRMARNIKDYINVIEELIDNGADVYFQLFNTYASDSNGKLTLTVFSVLAENESQLKRDYTLQAHERRRDNGFLFGSDSRFGYDLHKTPVGQSNYLTINDGEAELVRRIFYEYTENGLGIRRITQRLNEEGLRSKLGKPWGMSMITTILNNKGYCGYIRYGTSEKEKLGKPRKRKTPDEYVYVKAEDKVPPIISEEVYKKAQSKLKKNQQLVTKRKKLGKKEKKNAYALRAVCECGSLYRLRYIQKQQNLGKRKTEGADKYKYISYELASVYREDRIRPAYHPCPVKPVNALWIDMMARAIFYLLYADVDKVLQTYDETMAEYLLEKGDTEKDKQKQLKKEKDTLTKEKKNLIERTMKLSSLTDEDLKSIDKMIEQKTIRISEIDEELETIKLRSKQTLEKKESVHERLARLWEENITVENRCGWQEMNGDIVKKYIQKIQINHDDTFDWYVSLNGIATGSFSERKGPLALSEKERQTPNVFSKRKDLWGEYKMGTECHCESFNFDKKVIDDTLINIYGRKRGYFGKRFRELKFRVHILL